MPAPDRTKRALKLNKGRIVRVEQVVGRLENRIEDLERSAAKAPGPSPVGEKRIAALEKENARLTAQIAKLAEQLEQHKKNVKANTDALAQLAILREPVRALVKSFKQTPGAPFSGWTSWMLSTFRKQGLYRRALFK